METYLTIGVQDDCEPIDKDIVYAGQHKEKAFSFMINGHWECYIVQTWKNDDKISEVEIRWDNNGKRFVR